MAQTVKINMYKFVDVEKQSAAKGVGSKAEAENKVVSTINLNTMATNNIGSVLNGCISTLVELKNIEEDRLEERKKELRTIKPTDSTIKPNKFKKFFQSVRQFKAPGFLESLMGLLGNLFKLMVVWPLLKWLGDPKNHDKIENTLIKLHKIFSAIAKFVSSQVIGMVDDLYNLLSDETDPWTKIKSFVSIWLKFAGAFLAIRYLTQPWKIIGDFMRVWQLFDRRGRATKSMLLKRKGRLMMTGGRAGKWFLGGFIGATALWAAMEFLFPRKTAEGTLESEMDASGNLPGDAGYDESTRGHYAKSGDKDAVGELEKNQRSIDAAMSTQRYGEDLTNDGVYDSHQNLNWREGETKLKDQDQLPDKVKNKADQMKKEPWWKAITDLPGKLKETLGGKSDEDKAYDKNKSLLAEITGWTAANDLANSTMKDMQRKYSYDKDAAGDEHKFNVIRAVSSIFGSLTGEENAIQDTTNKAIGSFKAFEKGFQEKDTKSFWDSMKEGFSFWNKDKREMGGGVRGDMGSGIITGPNSGYPVSLHPSLPPSFIGHGTEYVATKGDGQGYVIPLDNLATRRDPTITSKQVEKAKRMGFNLQDLGIKKLKGGGIFETLGNWFGLAKDRDHKVSDQTSMGNTINKMQLKRYILEHGEFPPGYGTNNAAQFQYGGKFGPALHLPTSRSIPKFTGISDKALNKKVAEKKKKGHKTEDPSRELFKKLILAEARGEGLGGMAMVARSVLNRQAIIEETGNPGTFMAKSGSLQDIITAPGQYSPVQNGAIDKKFTPAELGLADRAIGIAKSHERLKGILTTGGIDERKLMKLMSATGFRNYSAGATYDPSQDVNQVKFGNHTFNTAGNDNLDVRFLTGSEKQSGIFQKLLNPESLSLGDKSELKKAGSAYTKKTGQIGGGLFGGLGGGAQEMMGGKSGNGLFDMLTNVFGGGPRGGQQGGGGQKQGGGKNVKRSQAKRDDQAKVERATRERNRARSEINARTREIVQTTLGAVEQSNAQTRAYISGAQQTVTTIVKRTQGNAPGKGSAQAPGGMFGALIKTTAAILNSFNNPLR